MLCVTVLTAISTIRPWCGVVPCRLRFRLLDIVGRSHSACARNWSTSSAPSGKTCCAGLVQSDPRFYDDPLSPRQRRTLLHLNYAETPALGLRCCLDFGPHCCCRLVS